MRHKIRPIQKQEWREYRSIRLRALQDSPDAFASTYEDAIKFQDEEWQARLAAATPEYDLQMVAIDDDSFVGLAWVRIEPAEIGIAHLYQMWVAPTHRGAGIGRALVSAAIEWAREREVSGLLLDVTCGNLAAVKLYESMGFAAYGDPIPLRPGSDLLEQPMGLML